MEKQCLKMMLKLIENWSTADDRVVPGVMFQIRCGKDENDPTREYQMNWFIDCTETFVHNHRNSFDTLCLEGGYLEKHWEIDGTDCSAVTYKFYRETGNICRLIDEIPGSLRHVKSREHFPGNIMHVGIEVFHSILPMKDTDKRTFTFIAKQAYSPVPEMHILSSSPTIDAPSEKIRPATPEERDLMFQKVQEILVTRFGQSNMQYHNSLRI